jgi:hypothetical protein
MRHLQNGRLDAVQRVQAVRLDARRCAAYGDEKQKSEEQHDPHGALMLDGSDVL